MRKFIPLGANTLVERQDIVDFNQLDFYYKDHPEQLGDNPVHYLAYAQRLFLYIMRRHYLFDTDSPLFYADVRIHPISKNICEIVLVLPLKKTVNEIIDWYVDHHYSGFLGDGKVWNNFFKGIASWWRRDIKDDYDINTTDDAEHPYLLYTDADTGVNCFRLSTANHVQKDWFDIIPHRTFKFLMGELITKYPDEIHLPTFNGLYRWHLPIIEERALSGMMLNNIDVSRSAITTLQRFYWYYNEGPIIHHGQYSKNTCFAGKYEILLRLKEPVHQFVVDYERLGKWIERERFPCTLLGNFIRRWEAKGILEEDGKAIYLNNCYQSKTKPYFYDVGIRYGFIKAVADAGHIIT